MKTAGEIMDADAPNAGPENEARTAIDGRLTGTATRADALAAVVDG